MSLSDLFRRDVMKGTLAGVLGTAALSGAATEEAAAQVTSRAGASSPDMGSGRARGRTLIYQSAALPDSVYDVGIEDSSDAVGIIGGLPLLYANVAVDINPSGTVTVYGNVEPTENAAGPEFYLPTDDNGGSTNNNGGYSGSEIAEVNHRSTVRCPLVGTIGLEGTCEYRLLDIDNITSAPF